MKQEKRFTSDGKFIEIYDDIFPSFMREYHVSFCMKSKFTLGSTSSANRFYSKTFFQSIFSEEDFKNFNIYNKFLAERLKNYTISRCWILASSPLSTYYFHPDSLVESDENNPHITLLYYINYNWNRDWGGETLFANDFGECEIAVQYKPGRVVIFDSTIEHKPSPISTEADEFRFIFVTQFNPKVE